MTSHVIDTTSGLADHRGMTTTVATSRNPGTVMSRAPWYTTALLVWLDAVIAFSVATLIVPWIGKEFFNWALYGSTIEPAFISPDARDYLRLTLSIVSAVTIGWCVLLAFVVAGPLRRGETWAANAVPVSVATWFVIDSGASILVGFPENAVLNAVFAVPAVPALVACWRSQSRQPR